MPDTSPEATGPNDVYRKVPRASECDLIMKGGVTSGVVYPAAILKLAEQFRFRSIGGASAGAIAATAAAAAEYGRDIGGGFAALEKLKVDLAQQGFLLGLFQASRDSKPLFKLLLLLKDWWEQRPRGASPWALARSFLELWKARNLEPVFEACPGESYYTGRGRGIGAAAVFSLVVLLPWALLAALHLPSPWLKAGVPLVLFLLAVALLVAGEFVGGVLQPTLHGLKGLVSTRSCFGMCTGYAADPSAPAQEGESLTAWMHRHIQTMAGLPLEQPLTIEHLRSRRIEFRAVTTDLSQGRPHALPFERTDNSFVFDEREMRTLFPDEVVRWMVDQAPKHEDIQLPPHFHIFPTENKLPLLVAMRLSLSFPVLLSAVRLYGLAPSVFIRAKKARQLEPHGPKTVPTPEEFVVHWFSDGGIASNFPIHLFDSWMPRRPTFGINLRDTPLPIAQGASPVEPPMEDAAFRNGVLLPRPADFHLAQAPMTRISGLGGFLGAIFETAQSYRDNTQAAMPGYRERIAHVYLDVGEGGLNLGMPPEVIGRVAAKGEEVARRFFRSFRFPEHQWVRLLALMSRLETELGRISQFHGPTPEGFARLREDYRQILVAQKQAYLAGQPWYRPVDPARHAEWFTHAERRLDALVALMESWARDDVPLPEPVPAFTFFSEKSPYPAGMLRLTPEL